MGLLTPRDIVSAAKAKRHGATRYSLIIAREARREGIPTSAGLALVEKETAFRNVFGHDPVKNPAPKGGWVTKARYLRYKAARKAGLGMQGVGPTQLTWYTFQDRADALGGCWRPSRNIRVGFEIFGSYYKKYRSQGKSKREAIRLAGRDYNGSGYAAEAYGRDLLAKYDRWHKILT